MSSAQLLFVGARDALCALGPGRVLELGSAHESLKPLKIHAEVDLDPPPDGGPPRVRARLVVRVPAPAPYQTLTLAGQYGVLRPGNEQFHPAYCRGFQCVSARAEVCVLEGTFGTLEQFFGVCEASGQWRFVVAFSEISLAPARYAARPRARIDLHPDVATWNLHLAIKQLECELEGSRQANHAVALALSARLPPPEPPAPARLPLPEPPAPALRRGAQPPQTPREGEKIEDAIQVMRDTIGRGDPDMLRPLSLRLADLLSEALAAIADSETCIICRERRMNTVLQPCQHLALCWPCAEQTLLAGKPCPLCRVPIEAAADAKDNILNAQDLRGAKDAKGAETGNALKSSKSAETEKGAKGEKTEKSAETEKGAKTEKSAKGAESAETPRW